jgi:uncharacterized protein YjbJ (UPF0337 family)
MQRTIKFEVRRTIPTISRPEEGDMNADQFKGKWIQFKGEVKKQWGEFTDDDLKQAEGDYDKFMGRVQERYGDKKEEVIRWTTDWYEKDKPSAGPK